MNAGLPAERVHFQSRIIRQHKSIPHSALLAPHFTEPSREFDGFLRRVTREGICVFNHSRRVWKIFQRHVAKLFAQYGANLPDLVIVPRGDEQCDVRLHGE